MGFCVDLGQSAPKIDPAAHPILMLFKNLKTAAFALPVLLGATSLLPDSSAHAQLPNLGRTVDLGSLLDPNIQLPATGAPIFFDAFLADNAGQPAQDFNLFFLWNVTGGSVDLVGGRVPGANDERNGRFIDLDGGRPGVFATRQSFPFLAGQTFNLSFTYKSTDGKPNSALVNFGGRRFNIATRSSSPRSFSRNFTFPSTVLAPLSFQDRGRDGRGIGIDNVVISLIPLPATAPAASAARGSSAPQS